MNGDRNIVELKEKEKILSNKKGGKMRLSIESFCILKQYLAVKIGEPEAILSERIVAYLKGNAHELGGGKGKWIYNSVRKWQEDYFPHWSIYKLKKTIKFLEEKGLIKSIKANKAICNHTKWYIVDEKKYVKLLEESGIQDFCFLRVNRKVKTQPIYKVTKSYYIKESSSKEQEEKKDIFTQLELDLERRINEIIEKRIDERLDEIFEEIGLNLPKSCDDRSGERTNSSGKVLSGKSCIKDYNTASDMIGIWNAVFNYSVRPIRVYVNKKNQRGLINILKIYFAGSLETWREYVYIVHSSKFLMREKQTRQDFTASFTWLMKSETIKAIMAGEYGIGAYELSNIPEYRKIKESLYEGYLTRRYIGKTRFEIRDHLKARVANLNSGMKSKIKDPEDNYEKKRRSRLLELYEEEVNYQKEEERRRLKEIKKIEALLNKNKAGEVRSRGMG